MSRPNYLITMSLLLGVLFACGQKEKGDTKKKDPKEETTSNKEKDNGTANKPDPVDNKAADDIKAKQDALTKQSDELKKKEDELKKKEEELKKQQEQNNTPADDKLFTWNKGEDKLYDKNSTVMGTFAKENIYACLVSGYAPNETKLGTFLGSYSASQGICYVAYKGTSYEQTTFQTLVQTAEGNKILKWELGDDKGALHPKAIKMGAYGDGTAVYLCKVKFKDGDTIVGTFITGKGCLYDYNGTEYTEMIYFILTK